MLQKLLVGLDRLLFVNGIPPVVAPQHLGHAAQLPQGVLQTLHQRGDGFPQEHLDVGPTGVAHPEVEQLMGEGLALDGHLQFPAVGEIDLGFPSPRVLLREKYQPPPPPPDSPGPGTARRQISAMLFAPHFHATAQGPQQRLPGFALKRFRMLVQQMVQHARRCELDPEVLIQQRHYLRVPEWVEGAHPSGFFLLLMRFWLALGDGLRCLGFRVGLRGVWAPDRVGAAGCRRWLSGGCVGRVVLLGRWLPWGLGFPFPGQRGVVVAIFHLGISPAVASAGGSSPCLMICNCPLVRPVAADRGPLGEPGTIAPHHPHRKWQDAALPVVGPENHRHTGGAVSDDAAGRKKRRISRKSGLQPVVERCKNSP